MVIVVTAVAGEWVPEMESKKIIACFWLNLKFTKYDLVKK